MADEKTKQIVDTILNYLSDEKTYQIVMAVLVTFGVKIDSKLQKSITDLGVSAAELGKAIEALIITIQELNECKEAKAIEVKK